MNHAGACRHPPFFFAHMTRGIRNCNPLNIRRSSDHWRGLRSTQDDPEFCQFVAPVWGVRAAFRILLSYQKRVGRPLTIREIITRWAPPSENNTASYVGAVCRRAALPSVSEVRITTDAISDRACIVVNAMMFVESRQSDLLFVREAYRLFLSDFLK